MALPATYKPSPLSIGSPRTSPFRRPESPSTQFLRPDSPSASSTGSRPTTPTTSPTKPHQPILTSPSKLQNSSTPPPNSLQQERTPRGLTPVRDPPTSPTRSTSSSTATAVPRSTPNTPSRPFAGSNNSISLSQLPPALLNQLRQAFSLLDRASTGSVSRPDVSATLTDLGLPSGSTDTTPFFPPGAPQQLPLAQFLSSIGGSLAQFSREEELLNAFGAFDERDCGDVDVGILRDSLMHTGGERGLSEKEVNEALAGFTGKKAFGKGGGIEREEVFRYREWVGGIMGPPEEEKVGVE
ncbi:MAG: hypothetical protein Q9217_000066 [Psora testacea]